jgi:hypothetical protein
MTHTATLWNEWNANHRECPQQCNAREHGDFNQSSHLFAPDESEKAVFTHAQGPNNTTHNECIKI